MKSKVAKAGIGYTIGNILIRGLSFLTLPIFTRLMSTSDYGIYSTYVAYESIFVIIISLALYASLKSANIEFKGQIDQYVSSVVLIPLLFTFVLLVSSVPFIDEISSLFGIDRYLYYLMIIQAFASSCLTMYNNRVSLDFAYKSYLRISFANSIINVGLSLLLIVFVKELHPYEGRIIGTFVPVFLLATVILIRFFFIAKPTINYDYFKYGLKYSLPLVPHGLSQLVLSQFGKIIIQKQLGNESAGLYGFAYTIALIPQLVVQSLAMAWGPWFFDAYQNERYTEIKCKVTQYVLFVSMFFVGLFCVSPELIKLISNESFWSSINIVCFAILGVYFVFLYGLPAEIEYFYKQTKYIAVATVGAAVLNIVLCVLFVPLYGYESAVYITVITYILYFIFHLIMSIRITKGLYPYDIKNIVFYIILVVVSCCFNRFFISTWIIRYTSLITLFAVVYIINRTWINLYIQNFINKNK